jgi:hypothetical protein
MPLQEVPYSLIRDGISEVGQRAFFETALFVTHAYRWIVVLPLPDPVRLRA